MRSNGGKARALLPKDVLSEIARKGGKARSANLTPEQKSDAARRAVNARWEKSRKAKLAALKTAKVRRGRKAAA